MSNEYNKPIIAKAQALLREYGHEVKTGHLYEVFSKLAGEPSWNVAKAKQTSFLDKVLSVFYFGNKSGYSEEVKESRIAYLNSIKDQTSNFDLGLHLESKKIINKDFTKEPNALFVGSLGTGKTVSMVNSLVSWVARNKENGLVFLVDPLKGAVDYQELFDYDNVYPVLNSNKGVISTIDLVYKELTSRREAFVSVKAENIYDYEKKTKIKLNYCLIAFEEFHAIPTLINYEDNYKTEGTTAYKLSQIMRLGRSLGVWVWAASQKASSREIPAHLLVSFANKFVFRTSKTESIYLLGNQSAAELPIESRGRCASLEGVLQFPYFDKEEQKEILYSSKGLLKFQCCSISDNDCHLLFKEE